MAQTRKEGKRGWRRVSHEKIPGVGMAIAKRHTWGSTEKILRRNRPLWERLAAKARRAADKQAVAEGLI